MLQLGIVSGARQMITVGQGFLPVIVGVTDSSAPPNSVLGAGVIFQSFVLRPEADTVIDSGGEAGSGHGMPVILSSSQAIVISDSNGLASLVPSPNSILGAVEIDMIATAGTAATQQFIARSFWPVLTAGAGGGAPVLPPTGAAAKRATRRRRCGCSRPRPVAGNSALATHAPSSCHFFVHWSTQAFTVWYHNRLFCGLSTQCPSSGKYNIFEGIFSRCSVVKSWKPSDTSRR